VYSVSIAYLLWFLSGFGAMGFHRFYLGRVGTGLLWLCTGGLGMVGAVIDFFRLPRMVQDENLRLGYRQALFPGAGEHGAPGAPRATAGAPRIRESLEKVILRTARANKGVTSPGEVALEADIPLEEAKRALEKLVSGGYAEMRVRRSTGVIVYVFPEFLADQGDLEDL
jgi:hypothetical protein